MFNMQVTFCDWCARFYSRILFGECTLEVVLARNNVRCISISAIVYFSTSHPVSNGRAARLSRRSVARAKLLVVILIGDCLVVISSF